MTAKKTHKDGHFVSILTGEPVETQFYQKQSHDRALGVALAIHVVIILLLWFLPSALPEGPTPLPDPRLPGLVFLVEPGPGGGGGGGGEESPEPPSVLKIEGEDQAQLAVDTPEEEALVYEEESRPEPPEVKEVEPVEEKPIEVEAPVVAQAPDDLDQKGILEGPEQLLESAGSGTAGGAGSGTGTGIGEGQGSGIGEGWGGGFGGGAYRLGTGVEPPVLRRQIRPSFTDRALARKIKGNVILEVIILKDGTVGPVRVVESLDPGLDEKAIEAVRQWLFVPGKIRGQPVDVIAEIVVDFNLL